MKKAFITGVSRGLGKALAQEFLQNQWQVCAYGRQHTIEHPSYTAVHVDFSAPLTEIPIHLEPELTEVVWIYNAGVLGEIGPLGQISDASIAEGISTNLTAAMVCANRLLAAWGDRSIPLTILHVSSGAARHAYASWAMYCASKAGLDRFSEALALECAGRQAIHIRVFSVAPGVIDTAMQQQIRSTSAAQFPQVARFTAMHEQGQLLAPEQVAGELYRLVQQRDAVPDVLVDLRNLNL